MYAARPDVYLQQAMEEAARGYEDNSNWEDTDDDEDGTVFQQNEVLDEGLRMRAQSMASKASNAANPQQHNPPSPEIIRPVHSQHTFGTKYIHVDQPWQRYANFWSLKARRFAAKVDFFNSIIGFPRSDGRIEVPMSLPLIKLCRIRFAHGKRLLTFSTTSARPTTVRAFGVVMGTARRTKSGKWVPAGPKYRKRYRRCQSKRNIYFKHWLHKPSTPAVCTVAGKPWPADTNIFLDAP